MLIHFFLQMFRHRVKSIPGIGKKMTDYVSANSKKNTLALQRR